MSRGLVTHVMVLGFIQAYQDVPLIQCKRERDGTAKPDSMPLCKEEIST